MRTGLFAGFVVAVLSVSIFPSGAAQILVDSGETPFFVQPIILSTPTSLPGDYCGIASDGTTLNSRLPMRGDSSYLNIRWRANDPGGIEREIRANCYLNCPAPGLDPDVGCAALPENQKCTYNGPTGEHSCSITGPNYNQNSKNTVVCKFFDPRNPSINIATESRSFYVVDYGISINSLDVSVGSKFGLPIDTTSYSMFRTNFTVRVDPKRSNVIVDQGTSGTSIVNCGETARALPGFNILTTGTVPVDIYVKSSVDNFACTSDLDCQNYMKSSGGTAFCNSLGKTTFPDNRCWKKLLVNINADYASLPEFNLVGFLILTSAAGLIFMTRRSKGFKL